MSEHVHDDHAAKPMGPSSDPDDFRVSIGHERVVVRKSEVERIAARIALRTHQTDVPVAETLKTEHVDIERVPMDRIVAEPPIQRVEHGVTIVPVVEEVLVRQFRIVEEVRITSRTETTEHSETMTLRRQEVIVEPNPDDAATDDDSDPIRTG